MPSPAGVDRYVSLLAYEGAARAVVVNLKYRNARSAIDLLAAPLAELVIPVLEGIPAPVVTWAPTSATRRRARGYDQARLLSGALATRLGLQSEGLLRRSARSPQTGRSLDQRLDGPAFAVRRQVAGSVVVLDDVRTSGATISAAARALRHGGAEWIIAVCLAQTPLNHWVGRAEKGNQ